MTTGILSCFSSIQREANRLMTHTSRSIQYAKNDFVAKFLTPFTQKIMDFVKGHKAVLIPASVVLSAAIMGSLIVAPYVGIILTIATSSLLLLGLAYFVYKTLQ